MTTTIGPYTKDYVVGDVHGEFGKLNTFINKKQPRTVFACGDFGWWPGHDFGDIKAGKTKIYFCDGNHENHDDLDRIRKLHPFAESLHTPIEVLPNVFYCPRGTVLYHEGKKILFMGGAYSIDKMWRTPGYDWFPQEQISWRDLDTIEDVGKVDIVISHTCPESFLPAIISKLPGGFWEKKNDPSTSYLEWVLEKCRPEEWFFGHWHQQCYGYAKGCHWTALHFIRRTGWFTELT